MSRIRLAGLPFPDFLGGSGTGFTENYCTENFTEN